MKSLGLGALGLALALSTPAATGQSRNREFDNLVRQAGAAYEARDAATAIQLLERAYAIRPTPRLLFNIGRAHDLAGGHATAVQYYERFLASNPDPQSAAVAQEAMGIARRQAEQQAAAQRQAEQQAAEARALEEARARAAAAEQQRLAEEDRRRRMTSSGGSRRVTLPVAVAWGAAGVGAVAGGVLGGIALATRSSFEGNRDGQSRYDAAATGSGLALAADISFGVALAAGVTGLVLFLTQDTTTSQPSGSTP